MILLTHVVTKDVEKDGVKSVELTGEEIPFYVNPDVVTMVTVHKETNKTKVLAAGMWVVVSQTPEEVASWVKKNTHGERLSRTLKEFHGDHE